MLEFISFYEATVNSTSVIYEHGGFIRGIYYDSLVKTYLTDDDIGFNTQISRLPNSNIGVSVLTNDNEYGKVFTEIIKNHILDKVLELEPIDWSAR